MDILQFFWNLFSDYTLRTVALGSATLGIISGALGTYAVLRKQSLLGDAISHAALPGIALAFLLTGSKAPLALMLGAGLAGWLATLLVLGIVNTTRIKDDSALGLVLSVFFGFGLVLLTFIQRMPDATQAGLDKFLFGQAAALLERDIITMALLGGLALLVIMIFWKEFKLLSFDPGFGASLGLPVRLLDGLLVSLIVIAIVVGLQTVGVVLMSAMLVAPAAAARQWTNRLGVMVLLAAGFGALAGVAGAGLSSSVERLPTGPTIVLCASVIVLVSFTLAPNRGLVWRWVEEQRQRRRLQLETVLLDLHALAAQHADWEHAHSAATLGLIRGRVHVSSSLQALAARGWVRQDSAGDWALTPAGLKQADQLTQATQREVTL